MDLSRLPSWQYRLRRQVQTLPLPFPKPVELTYTLGSARPGWFLGWNSTIEIRLSNLHPALIPLRYAL